MDSLEAELTRRRTGLAKWGWVRKIASRIARQAGIVSPDGSVEIDPRTGGTTLRRRKETRQTEVVYPKFWVEPYGGGYRCRGGRLYFGVDYLDFPSSYVGFGTGVYVVARVSLILTGAVLVESFPEAYTWTTDILVDTTVRIPYGFELVTALQLADYNYPHLGGSSRGEIAIPVAWVEAGAVTPFWWSLNDIDVSLYHGFYTFQAR